MAVSSLKNAFDENCVEAKGNNNNGNFAKLILVAKYFESLYFVRAEQITGAINISPKLINSKDKTTSKPPDSKLISGESIITANEIAVNTNPIESLLNCLE